MKATDELVACYCFNPRCDNYIYKYKTTAITYLSVERAFLNDTCCTKCGSILKSKPVLDMENQIRFLMVGRR